VVRVVLPEQVLFATASDQPGPNASAALEDIAGKIIQQAPDAELTVLGHTDAVGSDAYNMALSKRRAVTVLHALAMRGLDPKRLSAVAIGKRQPIADDSTPDGRARNRRVEFLVSRCLKANMTVVTDLTTDRALSGAYEEANPSVEVLRLDPAGAFGLSPVAAIALHPKQIDQPEPATMRASTPARPSHMLPSAGVARPTPAPHYQPRTLSPDAERNPLGPAVPF
jgi:hypothetical protein